MRQGKEQFFKGAVLLFLAGLGSRTEVRVIGSIAITELFMLIIGPFLFFKNFYLLKREGFLPFLVLTVMSCFGCVIGSWANQTERVFMLKGLAVPVVYFVATVCFHSLLRNDLGALKWFLVGSFLSGIVSIFVFQQATYAVNASGVVLEGSDAVASVTGYALFWSNKINEIIKLPISCSYFATPTLYCWVAPIVGVIVSLLCSQGSGRAAAAVGVAGAGLLFLGGKSRKSIARLGRHIFVLIIVGIVGIFVVKMGYSYLAKNGILGYKAQVKYEKQTTMGSGVLDILMAGRMELFCALFACADRPIVGWGPKAEDKGGYVEKFLTKYGSYEDLEQYLRVLRWSAANGCPYRMIPAHTHIGAFWLFYGIFGLLLWLYVFWLMYKYIRCYASAIPQWFGFLGLLLCGKVWAILFSPPGGRIGDVFFIVCLLFCRAVATNKMKLPYEMELEAAQRK